MSEDRTCPRCGATNQRVARYCAQCGRPLDGGNDSAGRVGHPAPIARPTGFQCCEGAADLHFRMESSWGGQRLLGTESIGLFLFNAGYPLQIVVLKVEGRGDAGESIFALEFHAESVPRGKTVKVEIPSYEISQPASRLAVTLISAEYGPVSTQDP